MNKPNIVFIMADDMGYGDLSCYGASRISTPNMDRVAAEGIRFLDAHSSSAVCTPSRYSVLTGRYCWRSARKRGVGGGFSLPLIEPARMTVASLLTEHGYATAAVGKWHVGLEWQPVEDLTAASSQPEPISGDIKDSRLLPAEPAKDRFLGRRTGVRALRSGKLFDTEVWEDHGFVDYRKPILGGPRALGFEYFFGIAGSLDMPPYCFIENEHTVGIPSMEKHPLNPQQRFGYMTPGWRDDEVDVTFADKAVAFIEHHRATRPDTPFFLYCTPSAPHRPCMPPDFLKGSTRAGPRGDMVAVVDWVVGRVLDTLDRLNLTDNTLMIVTSDNGAQAADVDGNTHGHKSCGNLRGYKADIWDGGHREPCIACWPGRIKPGTVSHEIICLSDFMATYAALAGAALPEHAAEDSCNLLPVLCGESGSRPPREAVVHHSFDGMFSIRRGRWKLILGRGSGGFSMPARIIPGPGEPAGQLYDMREDPSETVNVWHEHPDVVGHLSELLDRYKEQGHSRPQFDVTGAASAHE